MSRDLVLASLLVAGMLAVVIIAPATEDVSANVPVFMKYHNFTDSYVFKLHRKSSMNYFYWKVEYVNAEEYLVAGLQLTYNTTVSEPWKGTVQINESSGLIKQYDMTLPTTLGQKRVYTENFNGPQFLVAKGNFSIAVFPDELETAGINIWAEALPSPTQDSHSYYWISDAGWAMQKGYELQWAAMLEPITDIAPGEGGTTGNMDMSDNIDCYKVLLAAGTQYTVILDNANRGTYAVRLYQYDQMLRNQLVEMTGKNATASMVYKPVTDNFYYLVVEYPNNMGSLSYNVKVRTNKMPVPVLTGDTLVNVNGTAHFSSEGTSDPDGDPFTISWDFDAVDGIQADSTKKNPTYTYKKGGTYTVTLTASDGKESNSTTLKIKVNTVPAGTISIDGEVQVNDTARLNLGQAYMFRANFLDQDGDKLTFKWDFGDNSTSDLQTVSHTYVDTGMFEYILKLSVNDPSSNVSMSMTLEFNRLPSAAIVELKHAPALDKEVELTAIGSDQDGYVKEYQWDFEGDGKVDLVTKNTTTTHTYSVPGKYNLTLYVVDSDNGVTKTSVTFTVKKKAVARQDNTALIAGAVIAVVVVVIVLMFLLLRMKKAKAAEVEKKKQVEAFAPRALPPMERGPPDQIDMLLADSAMRAQPPPEPAAPKPEYKPYSPMADLGPGQPAIPGQKYQPQQKPGGPALVPPPEGAKPVTPKLVPPPKPSK